MILVSVITLALAAATSPASSLAPPLDASTLRDLASARDGFDYREQAFFALVNSVRAWTQSPADAGESIRLTFDAQSLVDEPAAARGELFRIAGELLQHTLLDPPYEDVSEWFIRDSRTREPVMVYIVHADATPSFADRQHVQVDARFYKRMRFTARDRQVRDYPAFVGRFPIALAASTQPSSLAASQPQMTTNRGLDLLGVIAGPVVLLLVVFAGLRLWIARKIRRVQDRFATLPRWNDPAAEVDDAAGLPDDPAAALAELRRRAETK